MRHKYAKRIAQASVVVPLSTVLAWASVANFLKWKEEHLHLEREQVEQVSRQMLLTAYRCNLLGHDFLSLDQIREWHRNHGYHGGIVLRNFSDDTCSTMLDTVYDSMLGETEKWRRECYFIYYEVDGDGSRRQDIFLRGTAATSDYLVDFAIGKEYDEETGQYFHRGFLRKADAIIKDLLPLLHNTTPTYLSGHSLGGAVAAIVAWKLHMRGFLIGGVTSFGSPKFCVSPKAPFDIVTVSHEKDPIPQLPPDGPTALYRGQYCFTGKQLRIRETETDGLTLRRMPSEKPLWSESAAIVPVIRGVEPHRMRTYQRALEEIIEKNEATTRSDSVSISA